MSLTPGTAIGPYQIRAGIGVGGMGEVYRATDVKLSRDVALKLLPPEFASDRDKMARFEREAQVLASLNHPQIASIFGLEESGPRRAIVMELVEGPTLEERIAQGPLPIEEVVGIAKQIVQALEYAHEQGVIHRDLKPSNIKITPAGAVKILDFGLAKALGGETRSGSSSSSPTLSIAATQAGIILGTAGYMSPEQAKGKNVDRRSDIWSFGVVVFEMLAGKKLFSAETATETMAQVMMKEIDFAALPADTPPNLRYLLRRCLVKDPRNRLQAIGEGRIIMDAPPMEVTTLLPASRRAMFSISALGVIFLAISAVLAIKLWRQPTPEQPVVRFNVYPTASQSPTLRFPQGAASISPDGRKIAFVAQAQSTSLIWIHSLETGMDQPLNSTEGLEAAVLMWSPDSRYVGFIADEKLKKAAVAGGPAQVISSSIGQMATWGVSDVIVSGPGPDGKLWRVPASGGEAVPASELDTAHGERTHRYPFFLPDGRHFFYLANPAGGQTGVVFVGSLDSKDRKLLPGITSEVKYTAGHVLFVREGTLMAQPFDTQRLELAGEPFPVVESVAPDGATAGAYSAALEGTLAFRPLLDRPNSQLFWFDRTGKQLSAVGSAGEINDIELSPNDRYVAYESGIPGDIWVLDTATAVVNRITSDKSRDADPVWSPDGKKIAFRSDRNGGHLYERAFGIVAEDTLILQSQTRDSPASWSRDGRYLAYESRNDIWALPMTGNGTPLRITQTPFRETNSQISPDGHWIAYQSEESGKVQIYIQTFPQTGARQQVSNAGGSFPRWSRDGSELFYVAPDRMLMAVAIKPAGTSLSVGAPQSLFELKLQTREETNYDVSSKGNFLVNVPTSEQLPQPITVILNWANSVRK